MTTEIVLPEHHKRQFDDAYEEYKNDMIFIVARKDYGKLFFNDGIFN